MYEKGDRVRVQGFGGRTAILRVWEQRERGLLLCSEAGYRRALEGGEVVTVGFPWSDVKEKMG